MARLSSHVPDPRLLTVHAEQGAGPLHRRNAWTKVAVLAVLVVAVTVARGLPAVAALYAVVLGTWAVGGLPVGRLLGWYTMPVLLVTAVAGPLAFGIPGHPIVTVGPVSLSVAGAATYLEMLGRGLAVVTWSIALWMTTPYADVAHVIGRVLPTPIDQVALLAYRFSFVLLDVLAETVAASRARGATLDRSFWANRRRYGRIVGATLLSAVERSERLVAAMEARGYDGDLAGSGRVDRPPARELVALACLAAGVGAYALVVTDGVMG